MDSIRDGSLPHLNLSSLAVETSPARFLMRTSCQVGSESTRYLSRWGRVLVGSPLGPHGHVEGFVRGVKVKRGT